MIEEVSNMQWGVRAATETTSAWHNRTKLILSILEEKSATDEERRQMLDDGELLDSWRHAKTLIV